MYYLPGRVADQAARPVFGVRGIEAYGIFPDRLSYCPQRVKMLRYKQIK